MTTLSSHEARARFSQLIELAFYKGEKIRVERNKKPMAWIVGDPLMNSINDLIDHIIAYEPALADTLAILIDKNMMQALKIGTKEVKLGKTIPIEKALEN